MARLPGASAMDGRMDGMYLWDDRYRIGEPAIDAQHQKLFQICERITKIFQNDDEERSQRAVAEAVKCLKNYTLEHFAQEEIYQCSIGYEGFAEHRQKHEEFKRTILREEQLLEGSGYAPRRWSAS